MYNEIDLHNLDFKLALNIFKRKYNEALKRKDKREILIIHGYGANKLGAYSYFGNKPKSFFYLKIKIS